MNKDRVVGEAREIEGPFKPGAGEVSNDARPLVEGTEGNHHEAIGVLKDTLSKADVRLVTGDKADKPEANL